MLCGNLGSSTWSPRYKNWFSRFLAPILLPLPTSMPGRTCLMLLSARMAAVWAFVYISTGTQVSAFLPYHIALHYFANKWIIYILPCLGTVHGTLHVCRLLSPYRCMPIGFTKPASLRLCTITWVLRFLDCKLQDYSTQLPLLHYPCMPTHSHHKHVLYTHAYAFFYPKPIFHWLPFLLATAYSTDTHILHIQCTASCCI